MNTKELLIFWGESWTVLHFQSSSLLVWDACWHAVWLDSCPESEQSNPSIVPLDYIKSIFFVSFKFKLIGFVQFGPSPSQKNKTLVLDQSRTLKSPSNHHQQCLRRFQGSYKVWIFVCLIKLKMRGEGDPV